MPDQKNSQSNSVPGSAPGSQLFPNPSEQFGKLPHGSESFGTIRNHSEGFRTIPNASERKENHTLSVREVARMFEAAGVARTERSITNWCQANKMGVARLDCYFDPNERKYFITPQSVESAISEEKAKAAKSNSTPAEPIDDIPNASEPSGTGPGKRHLEPDRDEGKSSQADIMDLKITNKAKDMWIEQLKKEREGILAQLISTTRKVGQLETRLLQLEVPENQHPVGTEERSAPGEENSGSISQGQG